MRENKKWKMGKWDSCMIMKMCGYKINKIL